VTAWPVVKSVLWFAVIAAVLFWPAGTLRWPGAWVFLGEMTIGAVVVVGWLARHDPALLRERLASPFQREQVVHDKLIIAVVIAGYYGWLALMALDAKRWGWSDMPGWLAIAGALLLALCFYVTWLVFRENTFAAPVVKIQRARGQTVITTGPYAFVRHPMYAGALLQFAGVPLLLGSWLGLALAPVLFATLLPRIAIEEQALRDNLPGYADYAARVRWRLVPGIY
jgi:protein-S-isoprenylcysteine O-methyltransferase Ste14